MKGLPQQLQSLLEQPIANAGYELLLTEYVHTSYQWVIRLYIDHPDGVTLEDCITVDHLVGQILEQENPIPNDYTLEVSSPGIDRPLTKPAHFSKYTEETIKLSLKENINNRKRITGILKFADEKKVRIQVNQEMIEIPYLNIAKAKLQTNLQF